MTFKKLKGENLVAIVASVLVPAGTKVLPTVLLGNTHFKTMLKGNIENRTMRCWSGFYSM